MAPKRSLSVRKDDVVSKMKLVGCSSCSKAPAYRSAPVDELADVITAILEVHESSGAYHAETEEHRHIAGAVVQPQEQDPMGVLLPVGPKPMRSSTSKDYAAAAKGLASVLNGRLERV